MANQYHLFEVVISNSHVWIKVQASAQSDDQFATAFYIRLAQPLGPWLDDYPIDAPLAPSTLADTLANWSSIVDRLPAGWDATEYRIDGKPYPWCETLSEDCDCHGSHGRLDLMYCSDFGLLEESAKRAGKSKNAHYRYDVEWLENAIAETRRQKKAKASPLPPGTQILSPNTGLDLRHIPDVPLKTARSVVDPRAIRGMYCSIHKHRHAYSEQVIRMTLSSLVSVMPPMTKTGFGTRELAAHWLQQYQSQACLRERLWGDAETPSTVYKYLPAELVNAGAPTSLRATQILALNDIMECNVETMGLGDHDPLDFLRLLQSKLRSHLGAEWPWYDLLIEARLYASPRLSPFIQRHLNELIGVVSFGTDPLVPTMWAHYARNTGIAVGYSTKALESLGFELRPMIYSTLAPSYDPYRDDTIRLTMADREEMDRRRKAGEREQGIPMQTTVDLATFGPDWKSLSRLLLVKGISWEYESEVRLLLDSDQARDSGCKDDNGWPIRLIDLPAEAITEIWRAPNTTDAVVDQAVDRRGGRKGLLIQSFSAHGFRMQRTIGSRG